MWATIAKVVIGAVGSILGGKAEAKQYKYQQRMAEFNRDMAYQDKAAAEKKMNFEALRTLYMGESAMGTLRAGLGASGAASYVGAPVMLQAMQARETETELFLTGLEGRTEMNKYDVQARIYDMQSRMYRDAAKWAVLKGHFEASEKVFGGMGGMGGGGMGGGGMGGGGMESFGGGGGA